MDARPGLLFGEETVSMKTIGLIGGMSWESTVTYYRLINEEVKRRLGGLHSAKCLLYSVDFDEIERCQSSGDWDRSGAILGDAAAALERAGADIILICTNTMHKVAPLVQSRVSIPLLHIAEAAADELQRRHIARVGLLGTKYTLLQDFYKERLTVHGIEVLLPDGEDIELVNRVIYDELCLGVLSDKSRREYLRIIEELAQRGAEGVILGCTEIGLLVRPEDAAVPLFDTTVIHALRAVDLALEI